MEWLIQDPNVQELIGEWVDKGHKQGHEQGLLEGNTAGRTLEARSMLTRTLKLRSFPISQALQARIDSEQNIDQLESWFEAAITATSLDDVFRDR